MTIDWTGGMQQRFRYYEVDRGTWRDVRELEHVRSCEITRDSESAMRESAVLVVDGAGLLGEAVVRAYAECRQADPVTERYGSWERACMGTWICQTPKRKWRRGDGAVEVRAYSTLLALADDKPPVLHQVAKGANCASAAIAALSRGIAPVIPFEHAAALDEAYTLEAGASWLDLAREMAAGAGLEVRVSPLGMPYLAPARDADAMSASWTFEDGANSILMPDVDDEFDWYGLPNVVEVVVSGELSTVVGTAVNASAASALSTASRGRRVVHRVTDAEVAAGPVQAAADRHAARLLAQMSAAERRLSYRHGLCPVEVGDCVRVVSRRCGVDARARVTRQRISLETGCLVDEQASCKMPTGTADGVMAW